MERPDRLVGLAARGAEAALACGLALLVLADMLLAVQFGRALPSSALSALSGLVVAAAVSWRRRALLASATVAVVTPVVVSALDRGESGAVLSLAVVAGLGVMSASLARRAPVVPAVVLVTGTAAALLDQALRPANAGVRGVLAVLCLGGLTACVTAGGYVRWQDWQRRRAALDARAEERLDLARELHDLVAHYVTGIVVQAQAAQVVAADRPQVAVDTLAAIERAGGDALGAMRRLVGSLRSDPEGEGTVGPPAGLAGLRELVARSNAVGIPARLHAEDGVLDRLPPEVAGSVHRIVQESLTNARRHAVDATVVDVTVARHAEAVAITVHDDGCDAVRAPRAGGYGLVGMAERATALGGRLRAGPDPAGGWTVTATLPLDAPARTAP